MSKTSGQKHVLVGTFRVRVIQGSIADQQVDIIIRPLHPHVDHAIAVNITTTIFIINNIINSFNVNIDMLAYHIVLYICYTYHCQHHHQHHQFALI